MSEKLTKPDGVTVTLCAIVKNESHIIKEMLESMIPFIDRYDITDTGSDDGTPELIKEFMDKHDVPGEVYLSDWKGFGKSRTEAIRNCDGKATYAWMIDADDKVEGTFEYPKEMTHHAYSLRLGRPDFSWFRNQIFKTGVGWKYTGVLHEYAECPDINPENLQIIKWGPSDYYVNARTLGARNVGIDPVEKYTNDAEVLLSALTNEDDPYYEPNNVRYQFYLAQSYFDSQQWEKSEEAYRKRVEMGGWEEEVFFSKFRVAICLGIQNQPFEVLKEAYLDAWNYRPNRAEPLYEISKMYRAMEKPRLAWIYSKIGTTIPYPENDILFIARDVYDWKMLDEFGSVAFYAGDYENGLIACENLLASNKFDEEHKERIVNNHSAYQKQIVLMQEEQKRMMAQYEAHMAAQRQKEKEEKQAAKIEKRNTPKKGTKTPSRKKKRKR
jgi:glycosyltransferase involved in cell wall biosynthesis